VRLDFGKFILESPNSEVESMIINIGTLGEQKDLTVHSTLAECFKAGTHYLNHSRRLLEIGPGIRPIVLQFPPHLRVLVEPSKVYCSVLSRLLGPRENTVVVNQDALTFLKSIPDESFDAVVLTDVIEHLERNEGLLLISEVERVTSSIVGIFTPLGFMPQHFSSKQDTWGFEEADLQTHRSGWLPNDFGVYWKFHIATHAHVSDSGEEFGAMWAIYEKRSTTKPDETIVFTPGHEMDRDSALFEFSHSNNSAEIISNGYTRLISKKADTVEYGSNRYFQGVILKHKSSRRIKLSILSYLKLAYFGIFRLRRKKNLSFFNLDRIDKILLRKITH
jgi:hypothetical protein